MKKPNINTLTRTIELDCDHLKEKVKARVENGAPLHAIDYNDVKANIRNAYSFLLRSGYKIIINHKGQTSLLMYNK